LSLAAPRPRYGAPEPDRGDRNVAFAIALGGSAAGTAAVGLPPPPRRRRRFRPGDTLAIDEPRKPGYGGRFVLFCGDPLSLRSIARRAASRTMRDRAPISLTAKKTSRESEQRQSQTSGAAVLQSSAHVRERAFPYVSMDRRTPASPPRALTAARLWRALAGRPEGPGSTWPLTTASTRSIARSWQAPRLARSRYPRKPGAHRRLCADPLSPALRVDRRLLGRTPRHCPENVSYELRLPICWASRFEAVESVRFWVV
jgi:hypothetical protein